MTEAPRLDNAMVDDGPSPWWPCPECGGIHFRTVCTWERGQWHERPDGEHEWRADDPPDGRPTGIYAECECIACGTVTNLARHYGWPIVGEFDGADTP